MVASPLRPERGPATVALHKLQQDTLGEIADFDATARAACFGTRHRWLFYFKYRVSIPVEDPYGNL